MLQLTQGMYADLNCNLFGLQYGQNLCGKEIIRNAGWYNHLGQKLGYGDLSIEDLDKIAASIAEEELFIVLSELDSTWGLPSSLDRFAPGIDYVMQHAVWIASGFKGGQCDLYKICNSIVVESNGVTEEFTSGTFKESCIDNIEVIELTRDKLFDELGYDCLEQKFSQKENSTSPVVRADTHYGLTIYDFPDGASWAVGSDTAVCDAAMLKVKETLYTTELVHLRRFISVTNGEIDCVEDMVDRWGSATNGILKLLLGSKIDDYVNHYLSAHGLAPILGEYDGSEWISDSVQGLPAGFYAYRLS